MCVWEGEGAWIKHFSIICHYDDDYHSLERKKGFDDGFAMVVPLLLLFLAIECPFTT